MTKNVVPWLWRSKTVPIGKGEHSVAALQRQINRLFSEFSSGSSLIPDFVSEPLVQLGERLSSFVPNVNVAKGDSALIVTVEVPGMEAKDIEISVTRDGVTIRGDRKPFHEALGGGDSVYVESSFGSFERIIPLSDSVVDEDAIEATADKGIVTIVLPVKNSAVSGAVKRVRIQES
jgi:HSP20 family protein